jgi:hypothetical protein
MAAIAMGLLADRLVGRMKVRDRCYCCFPVDVLLNILMIFFIDSIIISILVVIIVFFVGSGLNGQFHGVVENFEGLHESMPHLS